MSDETGGRLPPTGSRTQSRGRTLTGGDFSLLNTLSWSISELHSNREAMAASRFGERLLAGTMLLAVIQGLHESSDGLRALEEAHQLRFTRTVRLVARFRAPVLPGDTLQATTELAAVAGGIAIFNDTATNQRHETVAEVERHVSFERVGSDPLA